MLERIRNEWAFDTAEGWTLRTKIHNAMWVALQPFLPRRLHRAIFRLIAR